MSKDVRSRVLALGGMMLALKLVRQIAETGQVEAAGAACALGSIFQIDAATADAVYPDPSALRGGLLLVRDYLGDRHGDEALPKLGMAILQIERRFVADAEMTRRVRSGIQMLATTAERQGSAHPEVAAKLGQLYADTVSQLRPKVIVTGNPHYLQQADVVSEIRALLLAALRSAVLWRQMGGSLWDFVFLRRAMMQAVEDFLD